MDNIILDEEHLNQVRLHLEKRITEKLNTAGIYYRMFSRVKSEKSLKEKLSSGKYSNDGDGAKLQDIIGIRINLYYYEDLNICEKLLEETYVLDNWSKSDKAENTFDAQKRNGVFKIPGRYLFDVDENLWENPIDRTFEVQLRTVLFEGWHEIEHDMRYKDAKNNRPCIWEGHEKLSRIMNSVLANLELCDWTIVQIFDEIAMNHFENQNWELAIRSKFRLKINEEELNPEVARIFSDEKNLAKMFFDVDKLDLVQMLIHSDNNVSITPDRVIYLINNSLHLDDRIDKLLEGEVRKRPVYERKSKDLRSLYSDPVFRLSSEVNTDNGIDLAFEKSADIIYCWMKEHLQGVFMDIPDTVNSYERSQIGFSVKVIYDTEKKYYFMDMQHISNTNIGEIWHVNVKIKLKQDRLILKVNNTCEAITDDNHEFSRPSFIKDILEQIGLKDAGVQLFAENKNKHVDIIDDTEIISSLITNPYRKLPVVCVAQMEEVPEWAENSHNCVIRAKSLARVLHGIAHVKIITTAVASELINKDFLGGVAIWWPKELSPLTFSVAEIRRSSFDENIKAREWTTEYEKSFRQRVARLVKAKNIEE